MARKRQELAPLLADGDPQPVSIINPAASSSFLLIGDHAGNAVPAGLAGLGLNDIDLARHIGWDIGVARLGALMSAALDATFMMQRYSRLVIDCNRDPDAADAIPAVSDHTPIPGNAAISDDERRRRIAAIHDPYQVAIADMLAARDRAGRDVVLVSLHSFTPMMDGIARPWQVGVLHDGGDTRFAATLLQSLRGVPGLIVGDNQPYVMDMIDHTVPRHAYAAARPYVELEIRQDELADEAGCRRWSALLAKMLTASLPIQLETPI